MYDINTNEMVLIIIDDESLLQLENDAFDKFTNPNPMSDCH